MTQQLIIIFLQTFVLGMLVFYAQRSQRERDTEKLTHQKAKTRESLLLMELVMASAKLSYACAVALKRGEPNGEVEEGIMAYEKAKHAYYEFLNEQAKEHLY